MSEFEGEVISEPSEIIISKPSEEIINKLSMTIISMPSTSNLSKKRQSQVWKHFKQLDINRKKKEKCTYCRKVLSK